MSDWVNGGAIGTGNYWYIDLSDHDDTCNGGDECKCTIDTISAFEDTQGDAPQWYAWFGTYDDHDRSDHTDLYPTREDAARALPDLPN